jgi:ABC-type Fe3+/spermidine/putrescine transport system ATPase subunit
VADFMGLVNLLTGRVTRAAGDESLVAIGGGDFRIRAPLPAGIAEGQAVQVAIRPENIHLTPWSDGASGLGAKILEVTFLGNVTDCHVTLDDGARMRIQGPAGLAFDVGQRVQVRFEGRHCTIFEEASPR